MTLPLTPFYARVCLFLVCALPSIGVVLKYGKGYGLVIYLLVAAVWIEFLMPRLLRSASGFTWAEKSAPRLAFLVMVLFTALFLVIYPLSRSGRLGKGTDRADALNISIPRLLEGKNPYTVRTFLGNPVTPLPGALILGAPFREVCRDVAYQNMLWVFVLFLLLCSVTGTRAEAFLLWITMIFLCPALLLDTMTGGDFSVNAIYCAAATLWLLQALTRPPERQDCWRIPLLAAFWGLCLCSRPSYAVLMPFVLTYGFSRRGWAALGVVGLALGIYAALVLPIYLPAPQDFSPMHVAGKLTVSGNTTLPLAGGTVVVTAILVLTAWMGRRQKMSFPLAGGSVFLAIPVPIVVLADSLRVGHLVVTNMTFALSSSLFAIIALPLLASFQPVSSQLALSQNEQKSAPL